MNNRAISALMKEKEQLKSKNDFSLVLVPSYNVAI